MAMWQQVGSALRNLGRSVDQAGQNLQGRLAYTEKLCRHRPLVKYDGKKPKLAQNNFVAPSASVIGDVTLGENTSLWYGSVVRGDVNHVRIGSNTNVQDRAVVHVAKINGDHPTIIGDHVTIGHGAVVHACTLEDESFVGMGAKVLDGAVVEKHAMVGAGATVSPNTVVKSGELWAGTPAKSVRALSAEEISYIRKSADEYVKLAVVHDEECSKTHQQLEADKEYRKWRMFREELDDPNMVRRASQHPQ